jgi:hypothetical protein
MPYFSAKDIAVIAIISALWGAMNDTVLPVFFTIFNGIPFLCEMVALTSLILVMCLTRKFGAVTITGLIVTLVTLAFYPSSTYMLGFVAASLVFDIATRLIGYRLILGNPKISAVGLVVSSMAASVAAGVIIGVMFMPLSLIALLGGVATFVGLHVLGGLAGATIGFFVLRALVARKIITPSSEQVFRKN